MTLNAVSGETMTEAAPPNYSPPAAESVGPPDGAAAHALENTAIDLGDVRAVMIAGDWFSIAITSYGVSTFSVHPYEFRGDHVHQRSTTTLGFSFQDQNGGWVHGPVASIQALRTA